MLAAIFQSALWLLGVGLALVVGYLLLLTVAALFAPRRSPAGGAPRHRIVFLIPAHNEERLLPATLASLAALDYPRELWAAHVVADNCDDATAAAARAGGAAAHERRDEARRGKGHALQWLIERLRAAGEPYDAAVVLDADTLVSPGFLRVMDARLARGERVVQSYYSVLQPEGAWSAGLRAAALAALHYLRPQGRMRLGGSAGLKGNGMLFRAELLREHPWPASLTEDIEYHMALILAGERATFAPDAEVRAEMPDSLRGAHSQNVRWERGRLEMVRRYVPRLLAEGLRRRSFLLLDAAVEQLIPPFSLVAAGCVALLAGALAAGTAAQVALAVSLCLGVAFYVVAGLILSHAPASVYRALLFAPALVAWKCWLYLRVLLGRDRAGWVRTARND